MRFQTCGHTLKVHPTSNIILKTVATECEDLATKPTVCFQHVGTSAGTHEGRHSPSDLNGISDLVNGHTPPHGHAPPQQCAPILLDICARATIMKFGS